MNTVGESRDDPGLIGNTPMCSSGVTQFEGTIEIISDLLSARVK
jgi:hypothetical protein